MDLIINGTSLSSLGVIIKNQTRYIKPKRRTTSYYIDGQDGINIVEGYGYDAYILPYNITLTDPTKFDQIYALLDGNVILETSDDVGKFRYAKVLEDLEYSPVALWKETTVEFLIYKPFRYVKTESNVTLAAPGNVTNAGTVNSLPLLKITGDGTVVITIGGRSFTYVFGAEDFVYIDSAIPEAYSASATDYKNANMTGAFPYLTPGVNAVTWTGTVTELVITPRSRYL